MTYLGASMPDSEIDTIWKEAKKSVDVGCDEFHAHSALQNCLRGDPKDIVICKLVEVIRKRARSDPRGHEEHRDRGMTSLHLHLTNGSIIECTRQGAHLHCLDCGHAYTEAETIIRTKCAGCGDTFTDIENNG